MTAQTKTREALWASAIPEMYRDASFDSCDLLPEPIIRLGSDLVYSFDGTGKSMKSLYLHGQYGSGKTTFSFAIIREMLKKFGNKVYFWPEWIHGREFDRKLLDSMREGTEQHLIKRFCEAQLLFIDDLDKASSKERFKDQVFEIIDKRIHGNLPTIITSNKSPQEIEGIIDGATLSRMSDKSRWLIVQFPKRDLRLEIYGKIRFRNCEKA